MISEIIARLHIPALNEMQKAGLKAVRQQDVILLSPTGSGKTLAFLLPLLEQLNPGVPGLGAMIIVPSARALTFMWMKRDISTRTSGACLIHNLISTQAGTISTLFPRMNYY